MQRYSLHVIAVGLRNACCQFLCRIFTNYTEGRRRGSQPTRAGFVTQIIIAGGKNVNEIHENKSPYTFYQDSTKFIMHRVKYKIRKSIQCLRVFKIPQYPGFCHTRSGEKRAYSWEWMGTAVWIFTNCYWLYLNSVDHNETNESLK